MGKYFLFFMVGFLLVFSGCRSSKIKPDVPAREAFHIGESKAQLKNPQLLNRGGKLVVIPFKAGENAAANPLLDTLALMIVKGVADDMSQEGSPFVLLNGDDLESADFVLEGFIEDFSEKKSYKTVIPKRSASLRIQARLRRVETNEIILIYSDSISSAESQTRPEELAYRLGQKLALYLYQQSHSRQEKEQRL